MAWRVTLKVTGGQKIAMLSVDARISKAKIGVHLIFIKKRKIQICWKRFKYIIAEVSIRRFHRWHRRSGMSEKMLGIQGQEINENYKLARSSNKSSRIILCNRLISGWTTKRSAYDTFLGLFTERAGNRAHMLALRLYGAGSDFGISLEVQFHRAQEGWAGRWANKPRF